MELLVFDGTIGDVNLRLTIAYISDKVQLARLLGNNNVKRKNLIKRVFRAIEYDQEPQTLTLLGGQTIDLVPLPTANHREKSQDLVPVE